MKTHRSFSGQLLHPASQYCMSTVAVAQQGNNRVGWAQERVPIETRGPNQTHVHLTIQSELKIES